MAWKQNADGTMTWVQEGDGTGLDRPRTIPGPPKPPRIPGIEMPTDNGSDSTGTVRKLDLTGGLDWLKDAAGKIDWSSVLGKLGGFVGDHGADIALGGLAAFQSAQAGHASARAGAMADKATSLAEQNWTAGKQLRDQGLAGMTGPSHVDFSASFNDPTNPFASHPRRLSVQPPVQPPPQERAAGGRMSVPPTDSGNDTHATGFVDNTANQLLNMSTGAAPTVDGDGFPLPQRRKLNVGATGGMANVAPADPSPTADAEGFPLPQRRRLSQLAVRT